MQLNLRARRGACLAFAVLSMPAAWGADLKVEVVVPKSGRGLVHISLYDSPQAFLRKPVQVLKVDTQNGVATGTFANLKAGRYAISTYQDVNGNGRIDTNWFGFPIEPWGFSNNPQVAGRPEFDDSKFDVGASDSTVRIVLR
jgi:uncharacterized protein (DUF2141 family)